MNYLELLQKTIKESGATLQAPSSVDGLTGLEEKFATWVSDAWKEIQLERSDWLFSAKEQALNLDPLVVDDGVLVPSSDFADDYLKEWRSLPIIEVWIEEFTDTTIYVDLLVADDESAGNEEFFVKQSQVPGAALVPVKVTQSIA